MKDLRSVIAYIFEDISLAEAVDKIKDFAQRKESCILLNLSRYGIYGDHSNKELKEALEWLFRGHDGYYAFDPNKNKDNKVSFYYLSPYTNSLSNNLTNAQKEALNPVLAKKSLPVFALMKYYGYNITLRQCLETDLSWSYGYGLKTLAAVSEAKERALRNEPKCQGQMFFYFKDRSCYHLFSVSRKWYPQMQEFLTAYGSPPKEI